jgi:hypothetical protein
MYICNKINIMAIKKKNVMMTEETHCKLMEIRMRVYKTKGLLLTMEKTILYLMENQTKD